MGQADALLEDGRRVVGDQVDAAELLHELAADAEHDAVEEALLAVGEHGAEASVSDGRLSLFADRLLDLREVERHPLVRGCDGARILFDRPQDLAGLVVPVVRDQPTRRLGEEQNAGEGHQRKGTLEGQQEAKLETAVDEG